MIVYILIMGCTNCKKKYEVRESFYKMTDKTDKKYYIFIIIWSIFAIYGIIKFIGLFL